MFPLAAGCWLLAAPASAQNLPDGPGKQTFETVCAQCHDLDLATPLKLTRTQWKAKVESMAAKGATATPAELEAIVNYLAQHFGRPEAPAAARPGAELLPEGAGKQIILRECTACHPPDHFTQYRHTGEEWQAIVVRMGTRVRSATRDELETIQKYLAANFPKVEDATKLNINRASAQELEAHLSLTPAEAEAIVKYRQQHGTFREWGELLAIYGVDGFKIEAAKDRMSF
jgi:competence ComEA-like helix-hairpin-helix protein